METTLPTSPLEDEHAAREAISLRRILAEQAFSRTGGAPLVPGNALRLLRDAAENYPAWREAISAAERTIHFESYIIHEDAAGREFAELLAAKARDGVRVRLLYDWLGGLGHTSRRFWRALQQAGVEVRCFNPPAVRQPLWLAQPRPPQGHRRWPSRVRHGTLRRSAMAGNPARGIEPWRDTAVEIRGPAVADVEHAFAQTGR